MLKNPEGPSTTTTVCPKFTPMGEFTNNTAHSNMFYGWVVLFAFMFVLCCY